MSEMHSVVLYIGTPARGSDFSARFEAGDWKVVAASELLAALGMYVAFYPALVLIDDSGNGDLARQAFYHLRSIDAGPLLVLSDAPSDDAWTHPVGAAVSVRPVDTPADELAKVMEALVTGAVASGMASCL